MLRSDLDLKLHINAELATDVGCRAASIDVTVRNGVVTLSGPVGDSHVAHAAVCAAKRVFGVEGIEQRFSSDAQLAPANTTS